MTAPQESNSGASDEALYAEMRAHARKILQQVLRECSIGTAMERSVRMHGRQLLVGEHRYDLASFERISVVSLGKAGHTLAEALSRIVGGGGLTGIVSCPTPPSLPVPGFRYFIGGHPLPNADSVHAGDAVLDLLANSNQDTLHIFLISGGASAIVEKPISPEISLDDIVGTYKVLVHSGAPIAEINAVRKHLSATKGGRMAQAAAPGQQLSILVSDVPEHALDALASGPTMPDTTTTDDCYRIAEKYKMTEQFPASVRRIFDRRQLKETPKAGDAAFQHSAYETILSNATAVKAATEWAALAGFAVEVDSTCDDWDYADAADHLLSRIGELRRGASRVCIISGGEVTVSAGANPGAGGRNQQFALYCAQKIAGQPITVMSAGTDGIDGNSPAAGAIADGSTVARAKGKGLDAAKALKHFDAFPLFEALGDALMTGPTGTNVRDLRVLLAY